MLLFVYLKWCQILLGGVTRPLAHPSPSPLEPPPRLPPCFTLRYKLSRWAQNSLAVGTCFIALTLIMLSLLFWDGNMIGLAYFPKWNVGLTCFLAPFDSTLVRSPSDSLNWKMKWRRDQSKTIESRYIKLVKQSNPPKIHLFIFDFLPMILFL